MPQPRRSPGRSDRNPDATRLRIIEAAFREIHCNGYQGMRLDHVLHAAGTTKGGLYHHFESKKELACAVIDTIIADSIDEHWVKPLKSAGQPLQALIGIIESHARNVTQDILTYGCPLNNLAQEMSPLDEAFRQRLNAIYQRWQDGIAAALERGKVRHQVRHSVNSGEAALFILASLEGCIGMAKSAQEAGVLTSCTAGLLGYLRSLAQ